MDIKYHRSMLIGGAVRKGNGWVLIVDNTKTKTLFLPATLDDKMVHMKVSERKAKKNARPKR